MSRKHSAESIAKMRAAKMGHEVSAETRAKIGATSRGRVPSIETRAKLSAKSKRHGMYGTRIYRCWDGIMQRCLNPNAAAYRTYGALGITVCERWRDFANFYEDMGDHPGKGWSIDRIDNSKGYEPGNCRWATSSQQLRNRPNFRPDKKSAQSYVRQPGFVPAR